MTGAATKAERARVKLVTIVATEKLREELEDLMQTFLASGYTLVRVDGHGRHGRRIAALAGLGNVRIEALLKPQQADDLLSTLAAKYEGRALTAFSHDVEAIPKGHFE